jgi:hypothetical protein
VYEAFRRAIYEDQTGEDPLSTPYLSTYNPKSLPASPSFVSKNLKLGPDSGFNGTWCAAPTGAAVLTNLPVPSSCREGEREGERKGGRERRRERLRVTPCSCAEFDLTAELIHRGYAVASESQKEL